MIQFMGMIALFSPSIILMGCALNEMRKEQDR